MIQLPQNRADLVFEIDEGPLTSVSSIRFIGNKVFDDDDLRGVIQTREKSGITSLRRMTPMTLTELNLIVSY